MKQHCGFWFPESEKHMLKHVAEGVPYQSRLSAIAVFAAQRYRLAIDVGAHVGMFSMVFEQAFDRVMAFEPVLDNIECLYKNAPKTIVQPVALGAESGDVTLSPVDGNSGAFYVEPDGNKGQVSARMLKLDDYGLEPDLIKIDVEGKELDVLRGAKQTIKKHNPVLVIECKRGPERYGLEQHASIEFVKALGYNRLLRVHEDWLCKKV